MRTRLHIVLVVVTSLSVWAAGWREELPAPSYRMLNAMVVHFSAAQKSDARPADVALPLAQGLDAHHGTSLGARLREAALKGDRSQAYAVTEALVLLDAQDLLEDITRDTYTGWSDALVQARKAFLDYGLITKGLHQRAPTLDAQVIDRFGRLAAALRESDLTTDPGAITRLRDELVHDLAALRAQVLASAPARDGG